MTWNELKQLLATGNHLYDPELLETSPLGLKKYAAIARDVRHHSNRGREIGRGRTADAAITFRMLAGFPGEVNRYHPMSIEPVLVDASAPPAFYGQGLVIDPTTQGVRPIVAGDSALVDVYGILVRPFPTQQQTGGMSASFGGGTPPATGVVDVLRNGYILVPINTGQTAPVKGAQAYIWFAVTSGNHVQGGWETANTGGSTLAVGLPPRTTWQGGMDANNVAELAFHE